MESSESDYDRGLRRPNPTQITTKIARIRGGSFQSQSHKTKVIVL